MVKLCVLNNTFNDVSEVLKPRIGIATFNTLVLDGLLLYGIGYSGI